ncbi:MAG: hypothetical protein HOD17_09120 [Desulfobacteraceae bacterium]|jgi:hypothetical protein|nr:hypothetical protein [Desulfobacteraceae bacterium]
MLKMKKVLRFFVNDGSLDKTFETLNDLTLVNPARIQRVNLGTNSGKTEAVRQGFLTAFKGNFIISDIGTQTWPRR